MEKRGFDYNDRQHALEAIRILLHLELIGAFVYEELCAEIDKRTGE